MILVVVEALTVPDISRATRQADPQPAAAAAPPDFHGNFHQPLLCAPSFLIGI